MKGVVFIKSRISNIFKKLGLKIFSDYSEHPVLFCAISAFLLEFYIETFSRHSLTDGVRYLFDQPLAFICNVIIIFVTMAISFPLRRGIAAWTTAFMLWFIFGTANAIVLMNRPSPFTGADFSILPSVLEIFTVYLEIWQMILICVGILGVIFGLVMLWVKCPKREPDKKRSLTDLCVSAVSTALVIHLAIIGGVLTTNYGNLLDAYYQSGFPYSFARSVFCHGIDKPDEYNKEDVEELLSQIDALGRPEGTPFDGGEAPDVIFVQLESFFDIKAVNNVSFSEDPIPCFTELKKNYPSGTIRVPLIGSGTANTEFEILTGMNIDYFSPGEYPFIASLDDPDRVCQSIATSLAKYGYTSHSMHNNTGTFYNRHRVYPNLGFNSFTPIEYMYDLEYNELGWAKDTVLIKEIEKALASSEGSDFVFTVAVQPHGAYPTEQTGEYKIKVSGIPEDEIEKYHMYSYYVNQIKETDEFVRQLTEHYSNVDKNTVIVFYGDHLPDLKLTEEDLSVGDLYTTEYVVWSNYGLGDKETAPENIEAFQLSAYIYSLLNIDGGIMNGVHRLYANGDPELYDEKMRLIEYDALYGEKYCYRGEIPSSVDMRFGNTEITLDSHTFENGVITVWGKGFNEFSVIYLDGKRVDTVLNPDGTLTADRLRGFKNLQVKQEAKDETVFEE